MLFRSGSISFDADGTPSAPAFAFVEPRLPPTRTNILPGWQPSYLEADAARTETRSRVERDCANADLPAAVFVGAVAHAVATTFSQAEWEGKAAPLTRVCVPLGGDFWSVRLGALEVCYPPPNGRGRLVDTNIDGSETLTVFSQDEGVAKIDIRRSAVARQVTEERARVGNVLMSALHPPEWIFRFLDLARALQVPEAVAAPAAPFIRPAWKVFRHPDGRVWAIRPGGPGYLLRLGDPADEPVVKERKSTHASAEISRLITEQRADGFVPAPDEPS